MTTPASSSSSPPNPPPSSPPEACEEVACKTKVDLFERLRRTAATTSTAAAADDRAASLVALYKAQQRILDSSPSSSPSPSSYNSCPLDRDGLGRATWGLLHTVAAHYPSENPSERDVAAASALVSSLAHLYPCAHCREDFREEVALRPPRLQNREAFAIWACEQHNAVNEKLGKPAFSCDFARLDERWRVGSEACRAAFGEETASESLGQD